jgi:hypothetical protein
MIKDNPTGGLIEELMAGFAAADWGGCDQCDADVVVIHHADGVGMVEIRHEPDCPELARHQ